MPGAGVPLFGRFAFFCGGEMKFRGRGWGWEKSEVVGRLILPKRLELICLDFFERGPGGRELCIGKLTGGDEFAELFGLVRSERERLERPAHRMNFTGELWIV